MESSTDLGEDCTNLRMRYSVLVFVVESFVRNRCPCFVRVQRMVLLFFLRRSTCLE